MVALGEGEEGASGGEVTAQESFEHGPLQGDFGEVLLVFGRGAGGGADHVAEVVEGEAGHDGVEVDDAEGFAGAVVEHDVIELGVVVGDALGELGVQEDAGEGLEAEGEVDLGLGEGDAVGGVGGDGLLERGEAFGGVVEVGDGVVEAGRGEVSELMLEEAEGFGGLIGLGGGFDDVEGVSVLDEGVGAPVVAEVVGVQGSGVACGDEGEGAAVGVGVGWEIVSEFGGEVNGDTLDVLHERGGVAEDVVVDALEEVAGGDGVVVEGDAVGVVDVAAAGWVGRDEGAGDVEGMGDCG